MAHEPTPGEHKPRPENTSRPGPSEYAPEIRRVYPSRAGHVQTDTLGEILFVDAGGGRQIRLASLNRESVIVSTMYGMSHQDICGYPVQFAASC